MKYEYHIKRPDGVRFNPGDLIIERDESVSGAKALLKWLQSYFGKDNVTCSKVTTHITLEQVK